MNLRAIVNPCTSAVNPNFVGTLMQSAGYAYVGDAAVTGSISGATLNVTAAASGALAVGSIIDGAEVAPGTVVQTFGTGSGGIGTYTVSPSQTVDPTAMTATGTGQRLPVWNTLTNVQMQFQDLSSDELEQIDGLNISKVMRGVYLNGEIEGISRPGVRGGDMLIVATGLTSPGPDTWLVVKVFEAFDASGWTKVGVTLQQPEQSQ